jgi:hypothetical protein
VKPPLLLLCACILAWCLFLASLLTALFLEGRVIDEAERDLPTDRRPSWISLNSYRLKAGRIDYD